MRGKPYSLCALDRSIRTDDRMFLWRHRLIYPGQSVSGHAGGFLFRSMVIRCVIDPQTKALILIQHLKLLQCVIQMWEKENQDTKVL